MEKSVKKEKLVRFPLLFQVVVLLGVMFVVLLSSIYIFVIPKIQDSEIEHKSRDLDSFALLAQSTINQFFRESIDDLEFLVSDSEIVSADRTLDSVT